MVWGKARAANDMTIGDAEAVHAKALRMRRDAHGNPVGVWALLLGLPKRDLDSLMQTWQIYSCKELAEAIASMDVAHAI